MTSLRSLASSALLQFGRRERWRALLALQEHQWLSPPRLQAIHDGCLTDLLRHAAVHVPRYRDLASLEGWHADAITHDHLVAFPRVDKVILKEGREGHLADDAPASLRMRSETGGSSGYRFEFFTDRRDREERRARDMLSRIWAGWQPGDPQAVFWGHRHDVAETQTFSGRVVNDIIHHTMMLNAFAMSDDILEDYLRRLRAHRPTFILGYASALAYVAEFMKRNGIGGIRPRGIVSSAESLSDQQRAVIETQFGCRVQNRYGSREFAPVAQQCEQIGGFHVFHDRLHVEVLHPDGTPCAPGERGEITVTDFGNRVMPFIRYRTGDLAVATREVCPCGRGLPLIAKVEGRVSELIVGLNGKIYACPGPTFWLHGITGVKQLQIFQGSRDRIELRIVRGPDWNEATERAFVARVQELLGPMEVVFAFRNTIPVSASGKYRFAISEVSPFVSRSDRS